ncbi:MAG: outer membrane lipoprotein-sorting protein [Verrucomicrobiota bacterium]
MIDRFALQLADKIIQFRWWILGFSLIFVALAASGGRFLAFDNNYRTFFSKENPELVAFEEIQAIYTKNDNILFIVQPQNAAGQPTEVFTPRVTSAIEKITEESWQIPFAIRVDSITNFQHTEADGDNLLVEDLIRDGATMSQERLDSRKAIALNEPLLRGQLISPDTDTTGVNVTLQFPEKSLLEVPEAVAKARQIVTDIQAEYPELTIALSGGSMLNNAFAESGQKDFTTLIPMMYGILIVMMVITLRSFTGSGVTLMVTIFSNLTAMGIAGHLGMKLSPIPATAPIIIMTLAIADSIHLLVSMRKLMAQGQDKLTALKEAFRINLLPITITSVTTVIGFLGLNFSDAPPFRTLGNITAMGIGAAWFYSLVTMPALISLLPFRVKVTEDADSQKAGTYDRFANVIIKHYRLVLVTMGGLALFLTLLVPRLELNDEWIKYFDYRIDFRSDAEFGMEHLNGLYDIHFSVEAGESGGISNPEFLTKLEAFTEWLRAQPEITHVNSFSDTIKRLNKNMNGDDPAYYKIPETRELAAQYILLYELSLPYGLDLNDRVNIDKSATRITVTLPEISTVRLRELQVRCRQWLQDNTPPAMHAVPTGTSVMFSFISQRNIEGMLVGNSIALVAISGIMIIALRSFGLGMMSIIPNTIPILASFGIWTLLVGQVGMAAASVTSTSLGIVVDDTVHFLSKYIRARREKFLSKPDAIRYAFNTVGTAIVSTTIILAVGFAFLATSSFAINSQMGLLTAITIVVAMVFDFTVLPALLMLGKDKQTNQPPMNTHTQIPAKRTRTRAWFTMALAAAGLTLCFPSGASAETPEEKGFAIAARSDRSDRGFTDSAVDLQMILKNKAGQKTVRDVEIKTLEVPDENVGDKSLTIFSSPKDIDGTAQLSHAKILDPDDQWLYLPALKRIKRISSVNKSGPFVGSEFAFEDLTATELNKYTYKFIKTETFGGLTCDVIERYPRYEHSGYTKQIAWIDQKDFQPRKIEFYDRKGDLLKTLTLTNYKKYKGSYWRSHKQSMINHQTEKSTDLIFGDFKFQTGLGDGDFDKNVLKRIR